MMTFLWLAVMNVVTFQKKWRHFHFSAAFLAVYWSVLYVSNYNLPWAAMIVEAWSVIRGGYDQCACQEPLWTAEVIVQVHRAQGYFRDHTATHDPRPGSQPDSRTEGALAWCYQLGLETSIETIYFSIQTRDFNIEIPIHVDVMVWKGFHITRLLRGESTGLRWISLRKSVDVFFVVTWTNSLSCHW